MTTDENSTVPNNFSCFSSTTSMMEDLDVAFDRHSLAHVINRIHRAQQGTMESLDYKYRTLLIKKNMGCLRLCQLDRGELLREVGAIEALLDTLTEVNKCIESNSEHFQIEAIELAIASWGALRELACGSIGNRTAIRKFKDENDVDGIMWIAKYLMSYHKIPWSDMNDSEIRLVTAVIGVARNVTHKTPENCIQCHDCGISSLLIWRLLNAGEKNNISLPDQSKPWREADFRASVTLINISEEHEPCLHLCSMNPILISRLLHSWGSNKRLKTVFKRMVESARTNLPCEQYISTWDGMNC
mmetsp:Transcript_32830/g.49521  ORF Transcript_32830/g.49521 Transcript_32830/m.49521 type:complete len:301 (-) Transcript_32830:344-1246(-)